MRKALVNTATGIIENSIIVSLDNLPEVPQGYHMQDEAGGRIGDRWEDGAWVNPPVDLIKLRKFLSCTKMQGILTLGEAEWGKVLSYRETATWSEKTIIDSAQDWQRNSQNIAFFGHLLDYTDEQMDTLFLQAAQVNA